MHYLFRSDGSRLLADEGLVFVIQVTAVPLIGDNEK